MIKWAGVIWTNVIFDFDGLPFHVMIRALFRRQRTLCFKKRSLKAGVDPRVVHNVMSNMRESLLSVTGGVVASADNSGSTPTAHILHKLRSHTRTSAPVQSSTMSKSLHESSFSTALARAVATALPFDAALCAITDASICPAVACPSTRTAVFVVPSYGFAGALEETIAALADVDAIVATSSPYPEHLASAANPVGSGVQLAPFVPLAAPTVAVAFARPSPGALASGHIMCPCGQSLSSPTSVVAHLMSQRHVQWARSDPVAAKGVTMHWLRARFPQSLAVVPPSLLTRARRRGPPGARTRATADRQSSAARRTVPLLADGVIATALTPLCGRDAAVDVAAAALRLHARGWRVVVVASPMAVVAVAERTRGALADGAPAATAAAAVVGSLAAARAAVQAVAACAADVAVATRRRVVRHPLPAAVASVMCVARADTRARAATSRSRVGVAESVGCAPAARGKDTPPATPQTTHTPSLPTATLVKTTAVPTPTVPPPTHLWWHVPLSIIGSMSRSSRLPSPLSGSPAQALPPHGPASIAADASPPRAHGTVGARGLPRGATLAAGGRALRTAWLSTGAAAARAAALAPSATEQATADDDMARQIAVATAVALRCATLASAAPLPRRALHVQRTVHGHPDDPSPIVAPSATASGASVALPQLDLRGAVGVVASALARFVAGPLSCGARMGGTAVADASAYSTCAAAEATATASVVLRATCATVGGASGWAPPVSPASRARGAAVEVRSATHTRLEAVRSTRPPPYGAAMPWRPRHLGAYWEDLEAATLRVPTLRDVSRPTRGTAVAPLAATVVEAKARHQQRHQQRYAEERLRQSKIHVRRKTR